MISVTMVKPSVWDNCRILSVDWAEEKIIFNEHIDLVDKNSHEKQLEEKQKIIDEQLEIIRFYASIENYDFRQVGTTTYATKIKSDIETSRDRGYKLLVSGKKAREFLQKMESEK